MHIRPRWAVLLSLILALGVGFYGFGGYFYDAAIGLDPAAFPLGSVMERVGRLFVPDIGMTAAGIAVGLSLVLAVAIFAFFWVRAAVRARAAAEDPSRRRFLTGAASGAGTALGALLVGGGAGAARTMLGVGNGGYGWREIAGQIFVPAPYTHPEYPDGWRGSRVQARRRLGRTGWEVSDIVLGTGRIRGEDGERIARLAIDRGVNYFDTSPDYSGSGSEQAMGRAIAGVPRDQLFVATKFCTSRGHLPAGSAVSEYKRVIEESLGRLGLDYVDLVHIHSCEEVERLMDPHVHEAFDRLKQEGKVRFLGFSSHTPRLVEVAETAIASGRFDVMMLAYHHGIWPQMKDVIRRARAEQDMGVVAMKTLKGAKHRGLENFQAHAASYSQAALKWALSNPDVSCAVVSFFEMQHVDEFLFASGKPFTTADAGILRDYDQEIAGTYCAPHCGACLGSCPEGVPIPDVLRHRMYFEDYGWEKIAMEHYARLERDASACLTCSAPCLGRCPLGVRIAERTRGAHDLLTLS
jgi:predicted aldo/keto reductase-like oxidoreductase